MRLKQVLFLLSLFGLIDLPSQALACPKNEKEWDELRNQAIAEVLSSSKFISKKYQERLEKCLSELKTDPVSVKIKECFQPIYHFISSNHDLGIPKNKEYHEMKDVIEATSIPKELATHEFLSLVKDARFDSIGSLEKVKEYVEKLNNNRSSPIIATANYGKQVALDGSGSNRIAIYIKDNNFDKFIQITLKPNAGAERVPFQFSIVSSKFNEATKNRDIYFDDKERVEVDGKIVIERLATFSGKCVRCHMFGLLPLTEAHKGVDKSNSRQFRQEDQDRVQVGKLFAKEFKEFSKKLNESRGGSFPFHNFPQGTPEIAPASERSVEFIEQCSGLKKENNFASIERIKSAMNCAKCHNGKVQGRMLPNHFDLLKTSILLGRMPPPKSEKALTDEENEALLNCIKVEYIGDRPDYLNSSLGKWLSTPACPNAVNHSHLPLPLVIPRLDLNSKKDEVQSERHVKSLDEGGQVREGAGSHTGTAK